MLDPDFFRQAAIQAARVSQSTILILAGAFVGAEVDRRFDTGPWGFLGGLAIGSLLGFFTLLRGLLKTPTDDDDHPPDLP